MSHQCTCNKTTTTLCVQAVGTCQDLVQKHVIWVCKTHSLGVERVFWAFGSKCNIIFDVNLEISNFIDIH